MDLPWNEIFAPDCGTLLIIRIYEAKASDYQHTLDLLTSEYQAQYFEDGEPLKAPLYETIRQRQLTASTRLTVHIAGADLNCFFQSEDEINFDILPDEIRTSEQAQSIFDLMKMLASKLRKTVLLTAENGSATQDWSERFAICSVNAENGKIVYRSV